MKRAKLYYVGSKGTNFGDSINPILFEKVFGIKTGHSYPTFADIVGIGSILQTLTLRSTIRRKKFLYFYKYSSRPIITMGTGFMSDADKTGWLYKTFREVYPLVLRGKFTHRILEKINNKIYKDVAYGDLGLIFPYLLEDKKISKKYKLGVIPHNYDYENPIVHKLLELSENSTLIHLENNPMDVLIKIAECETIISSSLHGLIAADALNIPNKWFKLSNHGKKEDNLEEAFRFKFEDYYSVFDIENPVCVDLRRFEDEKENLLLLKPETISNDYEIDYKKVQNLQEILLLKGKELKEMLL